MLVVDGLPFEHLDWPVVDLLTVHWLLLVECDDCLVVHHVDRLVLHHVDQLVDRLLGNCLIVVELVKRQRDRYIFLNHRVFDPHMPTFLLWCGFGSFFPLPFGMSGIASDVTLGFAFKATLFSESTASSYPLVSAKVSAQNLYVAQFTQELLHVNLPFPLWSTLCGLYGEDLLATYVVLSPNQWISLSAELKIWVALA